MPFLQTRRELMAMLAAASQPGTKIAFEVPPQSCDCHTHVFPDPKRFPFWPGRGYTPEMATSEELKRMHRALGISRVVVVQPSVYGTDNSATLEGIRDYGPSARGVAVVDESATEKALQEMDRAGIRGVRLNSPALDEDRVKALAQKIRPLGWHLQINTTLATVTKLKAALADLSVPVVLDHFGGAKSALGVDQPGFADVVALVHGDNTYVKISLAASVTMETRDYSDVTPLAQALIAANPDRVLWGTDWPHPNPAPGKTAMEISPLRPVDDGLALSQLAKYAPNAATRRKILVENPQRLYGF